MEKTLLICISYPLPENTGSNIRTMNFVRFFKKYGSVDIAYSSLWPDAEVGNPVFSAKYHLEIRDYPQLFIGRVIAALRGLPYPIRRLCDGSEKLLSSIIEYNDYDHILVRYIDRAYYLFKLPLKEKKRVIMDFDDIFSGSVYENFFKKPDSLYKKMMINLNKKNLRRYEKRCLDFGASLFCSEEDSRRIIGNSNKIVVPNIYMNRTFENYDFGNGFDNGNILLFVGTLCYEPNVKGLKWFIESVYPEFKREHPDTKLLVVGFSPTEEVTKLCQVAEGVELHANAPDIKEYYKRCRAVVTPILTGGGTRIKILEAALAGRPVLSTPVGAEGLDLVNGRDLLLFQNAEEFSLMFKEILDAQKCNLLVRNAKEFVLKNYSMEKFDDAMEKVLHKIRQRDGT